MTTPALYQLADQCGRCGRRLRRRVFAWTVELFRELDPDLPLETIRCQCGTPRILRARAYQDSELDPRTGPR